MGMLLLLARAQKPFIIYSLFFQVAVCFGIILFNFHFCCVSPSPSLSLSLYIYIYISLSVFHNFRVLLIVVFFLASLVSNPCSSVCNMHFGLYLSVLPSFVHGLSLSL